MLLIAWLILIFILGAAVGSFLNVCIYRLPLEKSILWPGSRCGSCLQRIRLFPDNVPLVSYLLLRGRCRTCGARFSPRYFLIELLTGLGFVGLFYLEVVANVHDFALFDPQKHDWIALQVRMGAIPWQGFVIFGYHALLLTFLIVASFCDIDHMEIPLPITLTGVVLGLIGSALLPWPWPNLLGADGLDPEAWSNPAVGRAVPAGRFAAGTLLPREGLYPWPVWNYLPGWMPLGSWQAGLATGLAGLLAGMVILRLIAFLFKAGRGKEGLGIGDADLMMMVGCFLGWQPVVVAFFVAVFPALVFGVLQLLLRGDRPMPFGPALAVGTLITMLCWRWIGPHFALIFFDESIMLLGGAGLVVIMFLAFWILGLVRGRGEDEKGPEEKATEEPKPTGEPHAEDPHS
jgi:leader peptidase (prepilin peptidase)/N-methyltransferase